MKKRSSSQQSQKVTAKTKSAQERVTIGMDLGDKTSRYCMLDNDGEILREGQVATTKAGIVEAFGSLGRVRIAIEVGTHSPWVSRLLQKLGHEVIVANPRQVKLITESSRKDDRLDAQTLARLARIDPQLLRPIQHRSEKAQGALMIIRVRAVLITARTSLVNTVRGLAKSMGERLPQCDVTRWVSLDCLATAAVAADAGIAERAESLTEKIKNSDREISRSPGRLSGNGTLQQVGGVGTLTPDIHTHHRRQEQVPEESGYRLLCGPEAAAQRFGAEPTAITNHQGGRPVPADDAGARSTIHHQPPGTGYRSKAMGPAPG
jgi:transposase